MRRNSVSHFLDRLFEIIERAGILFALGIVAYIAVQLVFGGDEPLESRSGKVLILVNDNWKAALVVMLPVLYRPLIGLIRRARRITTPLGSYEGDPEEIQL